MRSPFITSVRSRKNKADKQLLPGAICHQHQQYSGPQKVQIGKDEISQKPPSAVATETFLDFIPGVASVVRVLKSRTADGQGAQQWRRQ